MPHLPKALAAALCLAVAARAQVPPTPSVASTYASKAPALDGRNDDAVWKVAPRTGDFRIFQPRVDGDPTFTTEFQVAHDARNLYVFVRMFDAHPDSIMRALSRRDQRAPSDQIKLLIDSYGDRRSGFEFAVNPDGIQRDYSISNDGDEDASWNGVWDAATRVDSLGWTAEFRIPLSQLRYTAGQNRAFGFGIWRDLERQLERASWPQYRPAQAGLASQLGQLTGLDSITDARRVEAVPYLVTRNVQRAATGSFTRAQEVTLGGDLKVGLTPNITLDATVNPDFGQVEADPAVVNLTAFEPFFTERRPFFLEGTGLYNFRLNCFIVVDCSTSEGLFYSRRIGRSPSLGGRFGDARTPTATPISAAAKLTGRTGHGLAFGLLDAVTPRVEGPLDRTVEPSANYAVLRALQDLRGGESSIGVITTLVTRGIDTLAAPFLHRSALASGLTMRHRFYKKQYEFNALLSGSRVTGDARAIARTQRSGVHFFQQPGDRAVLDTTRESLTGTSAQLKFGKYGGGVTRFESSVVRTSAGFEVNDVGFLRRSDMLDWSTWASLAFREGGSFFRFAQLNGNHWEQWNTSGIRLANALNFNGHIGLLNNWDFHLGGTYNGLTPYNCDRCTRGGPVLRVSRGFFPWGGFNSDSRKPISGGVFVNVGRFDDGRSSNWSASPYVQWRPSTRFFLSLSPRVSRNQDNTQWYGNFADSSGATQYTFARIDQRTVSMTTRLNFTASNRLTVEFYGEPFVSTGRYSDVRQISSTPQADAYDDRFAPYALPAGAQTSFRFSQLRTNLVTRWEFRPGSTLFVVWAQGRQASVDGAEPLSLRRDYRDLFSLHPNNTFLVKMAYWFNR